MTILLRASCAFAIGVITLVAAPVGCSAPTDDELTASLGTGVTSGTPIVGLGGKCLDVAGASTQSGARIQLWTCNQTVAQSFTLDSGRLRTGTGKCLDVAGANSANGTPVLQWDCHGGANQQWKIVGDRIVGLGGKCLDVSGGSSVDGARVLIWDCHGGANQRWKLGSAPPTQVSPPSGGSASSPTGGGSGAVFEGFDNGIGLLGHAWNTGNAKGYVQNGIAKIDGTRTGAGLMMFPGGKDKCFGNGLFEINAKLKGDTVGDNSGPANVLWPSDDVWPGTEVDIGEIDSKGGVYMATHWKGADGKDKYTLYYVPEPFDQYQFHTYAALLTTNKITYTVDGKVVGVETAHPAPDFAHGGVNHCLGIMNRSSQTGIEADWVRWTPESSVK